MCKWCGFLTRAGGRGGLLVFLAVLSLATVGGTSPRVELLNLAAAAAALLLGAFNLAAAALVHRKLEELHASVRAGDAPCFYFTSLPRISLLFS